MRKLFFLLSTFSCVTVLAQQRLTAVDNLAKDSDKIVLQKAPYIHHGGDGEDLVWDVSQTKEDGGDIQIEYYVDKTGNYKRIDDKQVLYGRLRHDCLEQYAMESRNKKIWYNHSKLLMKYPLQYGDSLSKHFGGWGSYCGNHSIRETGLVTLKADATGTLILSSCDTIRNTLRVYTLTTTAMAMDIDVAIIDSSQLRQEVEERYDWYVEGVRHPVYSTILNTSFSNMHPVVSVRYAYRLPLESSVPAVNFTDDNMSSDKSAKGESMVSPDTFHYDISTHDSYISVHCVSEVDANITALLVSSMGVTYRSVRETIRAGEPCSFSFNYLGLPYGHYVIYINVNGQIHSQTVSLK